MSDVQLAGAEVIVVCDGRGEASLSASHADIISEYLADARNKSAMQSLRRACDVAGSCLQALATTTEQDASGIAAQVEELARQLMIVVDGARNRIEPREAIPMPLPTPAPAARRVIAEADYEMRLTGLAEAAMQRVDQSDLRRALPGSHAQPIETMQSRAFHKLQR